jgi:alkylation response protein AidB-like acyl-CoA dehydrogenase
MTSASSGIRSEGARDDVAATVDAFLAEHWSDDITLRAWWTALADARLAFPAWPQPWGRSWDDRSLRVWRDRLQAAHVIGPPTGLGTLMGAPIALGFGTATQQRRWLPGLIDGTQGWCQLFSEPGAGSDLAGATTTATRDGDHWVVKGQKVWTSGAHDADAGMLLVRTDWDAPKHRGLSYFVLPMCQPGVEVRTLRQMNGARHFSEVFFSDALVTTDAMVGAAGDGWRVATATLQFERQGLGAASISGPRPNPGERAGELDVPVGEIWESFRSRGPDDNAPIEASVELGRIALLRGSTQPVVRQRLAALTARERIEPSTAARRPLLAKLAWTERLRAASDVCSHVLGADGMLRSSDADESIGTAAGFVLSMPSARIAGGTDEIQRNIIAERELGLPRDVVDRERPFRELPRNG